MAPKCGRMVAFQSSELHGVRAVLSVGVWMTRSFSDSQGHRIVLAVWFTLDADEAVDVLGARNRALND